MGSMEFTFASRIQKIPYWLILLRHSQKYSQYILHTADSMRNHSWLQINYLILRLLYEYILKQIH